MLLLDVTARWIIRLRRIQVAKMTKNSVSAGRLTLYESFFSSVFSFHPAQSLFVLLYILFCVSPSLCNCHFISLSVWLSLCLHFQRWIVAAMPKEVDSNGGATGLVGHGHPLLNLSNLWPKTRGKTFIHSPWKGSSSDAGMNHVGWTMWWTLRVVTVSSLTGNYKRATACR